MDQTGLRESLQAAVLYSLTSKSYLSPPSLCCFEGCSFYSWIVFFTGLTLYLFSFKFDIHVIKKLDSFSFTRL